MRKYLLIMLFLPLMANSYTKNGFYTIDDGGWLVKETSVGEVFICQSCPDLVQVQISYGVEAGNDAPFHNDVELIDRINSPEKKKRFASMLMKAGMPSENYELNIISVENDSLGELKAIRYSALVKLPGGYSARETTLVTMHKNRMVKFAANFYDDKLTAPSALTLEKLSRSIIFQ